MIKKPIKRSTMIINCWLPSLWDSALEVSFSLWEREFTGSINGCPKLGINELIGPNNSISWVILHFLRNYLKNSLQTRLEKNINWSTMSINCSQPSLSEGEMSSVMVIALGARGHGFAPRLSPTRGNWNNLSQQFHILRNIAFFEKLNETQYAPQMIKKLIKWSTKIINCWLPSSWDSALEVSFSLWEQEFKRSINGCPKLGIIDLIGPNNSISWVMLHFFEKLFEKQSANQIRKKK